MHQVPKDGGGSSLRTSVTSDSLLCLGYEICPAKGSCGHGQAAMAASGNLLET